MIACSEYASYYNSSIATFLLVVKFKRMFFVQLN